MEQEKILEEFKNIISNIQYLLAILSNPTRLMEIIREELVAIKQEFGDKRRSEIINLQQDLSLEDLITEEEMVVTLSKDGYMKTQPLSLYTAQKRGGKGKAAASVKEEDVISQLLIANTHDTLLCFSSTGKVYWLKVYQIPVASRTARGRPIINLLPLQEQETINAILPVKEFAENKAVFMATQKGTVKKTPLTDFKRPRNSGIIAIDLNEDDKLVGVDITDGESSIMLFNDAGKAVHFNEQDVRFMGRTARGVRGIKLKANQKVISLIVLQKNASGTILTATERGYGKRTPIEDFAQHGRGGQGVIAIQTSERNGKVVGAVEVSPQDELMLMGDRATLVRIRVAEISVVGRNTQGVRLINLSDNEALVGLQQVDELERELDGSEGDDDNGKDTLNDVPDSLAE